MKRHRQFEGGSVVALDIEVAIEIFDEARHDRQAQSAAGPWDQRCRQAAPIVAQGQPQSSRVVFPAVDAKPSRAAANAGMLADVYSELHDDLGDSMRRAE
jgi:hypothetical protein